MGDMDVRGKKVNKTDLQNNCFKNMDQIQPGSGQGSVLASYADCNEIMGSTNAGNFLSNSVTTSLTRRTLIHKINLSVRQMIYQLLGDWLVGSLIGLSVTQRSTSIL